MMPYFNKNPENESEWCACLLALARYLRGPDGCPWDREQTSESFTRFAHEELRELIEAFESGNETDIEEEFGDVLFCLLAASACAEAEGRFTFEGALQRAHEKMVRRHDHVFGETKAQSPEDAIASWNRIKAEEKGEA